MAEIDPTVRMLYYLCLEGQERVVNCNDIDAIQRFVKYSTRSVFEGLGFTNYDARFLPQYVIEEFKKEIYGEQPNKELQEAVEKYYNGK